MRSKETETEVATDEQVATGQDEVAKLRAELQGLRLGKGHDNLREASNDIVFAALAAEAAQLQRQIADAKERATKTYVAAGAAAPLASAKADLVAAVAASKAAAKAAATSATVEGGDK